MGFVLTPLPFRSPLAAYEAQAEALLASHKAHDAEAIALFHRHHPRFLDDVYKWKPKSIPQSEIRDAVLSLDDARLAVARSHDFRDWPALSDYVAQVSQPGPVHDFEMAVEAMVGGDLAALKEALRRDGALVRARSSRICCFDPPVHRATLLHYVAANGVEGHRQMTPPNAVEIAKTLLEAGAEADALADMYGAECTTMEMLVSSDHPARAGLQVPLIELLLSFGAAIDGRGTRKWGGPLQTALTFGMADAAKELARHGATIDLPAAAGLGEVAQAAKLLPSASTLDRHRALSLAAQHGHADIVRLLLDAGENPDRTNPESNHPHTTPLHQAALGGHADVVRLMIERGAQLDIKDKIYHATPLGWATHNAQTEVATLLRAAGAPE